MMFIRGIYADVLKEIKRRNIQDADRFATFYMISYACHLFNLHNQDRHIYFLNGKIPSFRLHILFMAPPGYGKTMMLKLFSDKETGILHECGVTISREASMTGAGFVGTINKNPDGEIVQIEGAAGIHKRSIMTVDEFSGLVTAMNSGGGNYSELKTQMLTALDSGDVDKRLALDGMSYHTNLTLWTGIQPMKSDLSDGLGRRLCFILSLPTKELRKKYKDARMTSGNIECHPDSLQYMRRKIGIWVGSFSMIEHVNFSEEFEQFLNTTLDVEHYEVDLYERIALGFTIVKYGCYTTINVELTDDLKKILILQADWRWKIKREPRVQSILEILRTNGIADENGFGLSKSIFNEYGSKFEMSPTQIQEVIGEASKLGYVKIRGNDVYMEAGAMLKSPALELAESLNLDLEDINLDGDYQDIPDEPQDPPKPPTEYDRVTGALDRILHE